MIRIADRFGQIDCIGRFDISSLMILAAPEKAFTEAIERAKAAEPISMKRAFEIRHKYDPSKPAAQPRCKNVITDLREFVLSMATRLGHKFVIQQLEDLLGELHESGKKQSTPAPRANGRRLAVSAGAPA